MAKDSFKLSDYREGKASTVPCPRCHALVPAAGTMCPECGLHFRGQAGDFAPEADKTRKPHRAMRIVAILILVGVALAIVIGLALTFLPGPR